MHIFQQQNITIPTIFLFKSMDAAGPIGFGHFIHEIFGRNVIDPLTRHRSKNMMPHGLGKVAFPKTGFRLQIKGILITLVACSQLQGGRIGEIAVFSDDKLIKGKILAQQSTTGIWRVHIRQRQLLLVRCVSGHFG